MANRVDSLEHLSSWHSDWTQTSVVVIGLAKTGFSVADTLHELGAKVLIVAESCSAEILDIVEVLGIKNVIGPIAKQQEAISEFAPSLIVVSPGVSPTNALVVNAIEKGIPLWGDLDLAWRLRDRFDTKQEWICVTGTNGKTTVVELTEAMLLAAGVKAVACGNIGKPILDCIRDPAEFEVLVVEMSSFQLHYLNYIEPLSAACLNIAEDHLDWHGSFEDYRQSKAHIFEGTKVACIYNLEDSATEQMVQAATVNEGARAIGFGLGTPRPSNVGYVDEFLVDRAFLDQRADSALEIASLEDFHGLGVLTPHLLSNIAAATALARSFGVPPAACREALRNFRVSSHRIELVLEQNGVRYINDSKATNAHAASASLSSFESVVWILGGQLKGVDISDLITKFAKRLRAAVVIGIDRDQILESFSRLAPEVPVFEVSEAEDVMLRAVELASNSAEPEDVVLLAPAAASMDQFESYQHRGTRFAEAVSKVVNSRNG
jgi:UDP-N-acetylmuramoylalanine--D-glutamate ligase